MRQTGMLYEVHLPGGGSITTSHPLNVERTADGGYLVTSRDQEHGDTFISGSVKTYSTN